MVNKIVRESISEERPYKSKLETPYGYIEYHYEVSPEYPDGLLVDLGGYVYKEYRGQGKLKEMLKTLFTSVLEGTIAQMAVANKHLIHMFKRLGFKPVRRLEYWGEVSHAMQATITKELIDSI
jgi:hypothetical protein